MGDLPAPQRNYVPDRQKGLAPSKRQGRVALSPDSQTPEVGSPLRTTPDRPDFTTSPLSGPGLGEKGRTQGSGQSEDDPLTTSTLLHPIPTQTRSRDTPSSQSVRGGEGGGRRVEVRDVYRERGSDVGSTVGTRTRWFASRERGRSQTGRVHVPRNPVRDLDLNWKVWPGKDSYST